MIWLVYAISAAAVWGLDYALGEKVLRSKISPVSLLTFQMAVGALFFFAVGYKTNLREDFEIVLSNRNVLWLTLGAIVSFNLGNFLIFLSIQAKNATVAGLVELCYPLFTAAFMYFLFKENQLNTAVVIGGILIISGIVVISAFGN